MSVYVAVDGDSVGVTLERLVLERDEAGLADYSSRVRRLFDRVRRGLVKAGGTILVCGGDTILARWDRPAVSIETLILLLRRHDEPTLSCGLGDNLADAWTALHYAKTHKPALARWRSGRCTHLHDLGRPRPRGPRVAAPRARD